MTTVMLRNKKLGDIVLDRVLIEYDGPKLFIAHSSTGQKYVAIFIGDDDETETFLYTPVSEERANAFLAGVVSGREVFRSSSETVWLVRTSFMHGSVSARQIPATEILDKWLPVPEARVGVAEGRDASATLTKELGNVGVLEISVASLHSLESNEKALISLSLSHGGERIWNAVELPGTEVLTGLASAWAKLIWQEGITGGVRAGTLTSISDRLQRAVGEVSSAGRDRLLGEY